MQAFLLATSDYALRGRSYYTMVSITLTYFRVWGPARLALELAEQRRHHHPARVAGLRVKRTRLTTTTHTRPMTGETNRE